MLTDLRPLYEIVATVVKVKAHTDLETYNDMLDLYFALGNKLANDSAITTLCAGQQGVGSQKTQRHKDLNSA